MVKNKAVFLDRDGTINVDHGYVHKKEELEFMDGVFEGLKRLFDKGYKLIIITNQSGIGRGYYTLEEYYSFNQYMLDILKNKGIIIDKVYFCPHIEDDKCNCRKPKLELFYQAIKEYNIDLNNSYAIGDKARDLKICDETNIKGILLNEKDNKYVNMNSFKEAVDYITKK